MSKLPHINEELDRVILTEDLPEHGLKAGDKGTVVFVYNRGKGYEVECIALDGETLAATTVLTSQMRLAMRKEIAHARTMEPAQAIS